MKVKRSKYFIPFHKNNSTNLTESRLTKGCFIQQNASGIFTWLNLGLRVIEKIIAIIDEEHQKVNAIKLLMPTIHDAALWKESERYYSYGSEILKMHDRKEHEFVYAPSAEEMATYTLTKWPLKKSSFPINIYNIQWKFRDEIRPRFAIARSREFLMKDAYSFHLNLNCLMNTYEQMFEVYSNIFSKLGISVCTAQSDVGLMGGFLSHEFLCASEFGETALEFDEWPKQPLKWQDKDKATITTQTDKFAEIGHIYALGDKYTKTFNLKNLETKEPLLMGCYGIGVSRLVAILFERPDLGLVAPFANTLITITNSETCMNIASKIFGSLDEVLWDDRDMSYGEKCAEADIIGSPKQIHIGEKEAAEDKLIIKENGIKQVIEINQLLA